MWFAFRSAKTDNTVFKLQYRCTVLMLVVFSFVITCRLVLGYSFTCSSTSLGNSYPSDIYCYTRNPFIVIDGKSDHIRQGLASPPRNLASSLSNSEAKLLYISYYPWVNLFFLVLAVLLYLPHLFWKVCEGGLMTRITSKANDSSVSESERKAAIIDIAKYVVTTRGGHLLYTGAYVLSEALNWLVGVLCTVLFVYFFQVNMFLKGGEVQLESWDDFFTYNFPVVAKCQINKFGSSGDIQRYEVTCYLALNKLYGYMFLFLYAWLIMMCVLSALVLPYRVLGLLLPPIRLLLFRLRSGTTDQMTLHFLNGHFSLGDWFLLTRLQKNLRPHDLIRMLSYVQQNFNKSTLDLEMDEIGKLA